MPDFGVFAVIVKSKLHLPDTLERRCRNQDSTDEFFKFFHIITSYFQSLSSYYKDLSEIFQRKFIFLKNF